MFIFAPTITKIEQFTHICIYTYIPRHRFSRFRRTLAWGRQLVLHQFLACRSLRHGKWFTHQSQLVRKGSLLMSVKDIKGQLPSMGSTCPVRNASKPVLLHLIFDKHLYWPSMCILFFVTGSNSYKYRFNFSTCHMKYVNTWHLYKFVNVYIYILYLHTYIHKNLAFIYVCKCGPCHITQCMFSAHASIPFFLHALPHQKPSSISWLSRQSR